VFSMSKIGIIGERDRVLCFLAAGFAVYTVEKADLSAAERTLKKAAAECAVLFITADLAEALKEPIAKYNSVPTPAIIPLPEKNGGYGTALLKHAVERAVGADIVFRD